MQELSTTFAFLELLSGNEDKFTFASRTAISPVFILKQVHSGEKAISPNIHWDVPALLENLSTSQVLLHHILNVQSPFHNGCCVLGAISF